jgi:hypothetical protein
VWDHVRWWEPVVRRARPKSRLARLAPTAASPRRGVKLIASGRASDIFDLEDGRVLRRFKGGGDAEREALVMRHALSRGYPVPRVLEVTSDGLVLERVEGQTMSAALRRRPWMLRQHCFLPARLHDKLHALPTPARLRAIGTGDRLLHFDLHPDNVILSPAGPVVIDWSNAHRGEAALDVALTWIILATSVGPPGRLLLRWFLPRFERAALVRALPGAAEWRLADPHVTDAERKAMRRLVAGVGPVQGSGADAARLEPSGAGPIAASSAGSHRSGPSTEWRSAPSRAERLRRCSYRVEHERAVVARVVLRTKARRAVVASTLLRRLRGGTRRPPPGSRRGTPRGCRSQGAPPGCDPELRLPAPAAEGAPITELHDDGDAERRKRLLVELA